MIFVFAAYVHEVRASYMDHVVTACEVRVDGSYFLVSLSPFGSLKTGPMPTTQFGMLTAARAIAFDEAGPEVSHALRCRACFQGTGFRQ